MAFSVACSGFFLWGFVQAVSPRPVYEYQDVDFLKQYTDYDFLIHRQDGDTVLRLCHDIDPRGIFMAGYHAKKLRYQDMGNCDSVWRSDLGVFWEVDENGNVKEIKHADRPKG